MDEFLPFDRCLARTANFSHASFMNCEFTQVNFRDAQFSHASMAHAIMDKCSFEGAIFEQTDWQDCWVFNCDLTSSTLNQIVTHESVFRGNDYFEIPVPKTIADASWAFPKQFFLYVKEELEHWQHMVPEVKLDYTRQILIKIMVWLSVPVLALLAWSYLETNWVVSMITAMGAMSAWSLRRYFTMIMQAGVGFLLGKLNHADGLWKSGHKKAALVSLVTNPELVKRAKMVKPPD
jgi:hypothetical protein